MIGFAIWNSKEKFFVSIFFQFVKGYGSYFFLLKENAFSRKRSIFPWKVNRFPKKICIEISNDFFPVGGSSLDVRG